MHHQAGRLVDDDQVLVLETDRQRHRLRHRDRISRLGQQNDKMLARLDPLRRVALQHAFRGDSARQDQLLEPGARQLRQMALQCPVEALPGIFGGAADFGAALPARMLIGRVIRHDRCRQVSPVLCAP